MRDLDVRLAVRAKLEKKYYHDQDTRIVEEMGVWAGSVRIDIAVINGELQGFELKSARDNLQRLPEQARLYSMVFDRVTLVSAERHQEDAINLVPQWWGITSALERRDGGVTLKRIRSARRNPAISPHQVARLLWKSEALSILENYGLDRGVRSATMDGMAKKLADTIPSQVLLREVRQVLKFRSDWLGQPISNQ
ncbi:MAG: sce7726 family protein [Kiloniellaceae bacterium]